MSTYFRPGVSNLWPKVVMNAAQHIIIHLLKNVNFLKGGGLKLVYTKPTHAAEEKFDCISLLDYY